MIGNTDEAQLSPLHWLCAGLPMMTCAAIRAAPPCIVQGSVFLSPASSGYRGSPHAKLAQQPPASPLNNQSD